MNLLLRLVHASPSKEKLFKNLKLVMIVSNNEDSSSKGPNLFRKGDIMLIPDHYLKVVHIDNQNFYLITKIKMQEFQASVLKSTSRN